MVEKETLFAISILDVGMQKVGKQKKTKSHPISYPHCTGIVEAIHFVWRRRCR